MPPTSYFLPPYKQRGVLFVLSGPSGVGKDALLTEIQRTDSTMALSEGHAFPSAPPPDIQHPTPSPPPTVERAVTATTRAIRAGEVEGLDYLFWTEDEFRRKVMAGEMLEWAEVYGNLYGTPRAAVETALSEGRSVVLKIDVQGAGSVRRAMPDAVLIFLAPPSLEELEARLRGRLTDSDAAIDRRLSTTLHEMQMLPDYDYVVVNDDLASAADQARAIFVAERLRVQNIHGIGRG